MVCNQFHFQIEERKKHKIHWSWRQFNTVQSCGRFFKQCESIVGSTRKEHTVMCNRNLAESNRTTKLDVHTKENINCKCGIIFRSSLLCTQKYKRLIGKVISWYNVFLLQETLLSILFYVKLKQTIKIFFNLQLIFVINI